MISGLVQLNGLWWPEDDSECLRAAQSSLEDLPAILRHVHGRHVCVQAGGNAGLWPRALAAHFRQVVTFEPEPTNFAALCLNCSEPNVVKFQAALGDRGRESALVLIPGNSGAAWVSAQGEIPVRMLRLDDLALDDVDLIQLDVEGYEAFVLDGAKDLLARCKPTLVLEVKGLGDKRHGRSEREMLAALASQGYVTAMTARRDRVLVHGSRVR